MKKNLLSKITINKILYGLAIVLTLNFGTTILLLLLQKLGFTEVNIVVIYILSVLITARYTRGYSYGIMASFLSMLSFNFFFTDPLYTFKVNESTNIITLVVMLLSSIFTSALASKLIRSKELANKREKQSHILYKITSSLAKTSEIPEIATVSCQFLSELFKCNTTCVISVEKNNIQKFTLNDKTRKVIIDNIGKDEVKNIINNFYSLPITVKGNNSGYICLPKEIENMNKEIKFLLNSITMQISIAIERVLLIRDKEAAKSEIEQERFKSSLLRSISHDLRTPLTRITGAAEMLKLSLKKNDKNKKLALKIYEECIWLTRLVENILSLTKIQEGSLKVNLQPEAVEEIIAESVKHTSKPISDDRIKISIPDEVIFVPMDGKLIEQVLINLINNAIEHSPPESQISISVRLEKDKVWFEVSDKGTGIDEKDLPHIFNMFYVGHNTKSFETKGVGLGLAICKAIVNYHGGEIYAENNPEGGATFRFYLKI